MGLYKFIFAFLAVFIAGIPVCSLAQTMNRPVPAQRSDSNQGSLKDTNKNKENPRPQIKASPPPSQMRPYKPNQTPVKKVYHHVPKIKYTTVSHTHDVAPQNYYWYCYHSRYPFPHSKCELRSISYSYYDIYRANRNQSYYIPPIIKQDGRNPDRNPSR